MTHEIFYVQRMSHESLTLVLALGGLCAAFIVALALWLHWNGRHVRKAKRAAREQRKESRRRRRRGQSPTVSN